MKCKPTSPRSKSRKQANTKTKLDKRAIRQALKSYARADKFIEREKRVWLQNMTPEQSWAIFDELFSAWEQLYPNHSPNRQNVEKPHLEETITLRRMLDRAARKLNQR